MAHTFGVKSIRFDIKIWVLCLWRPQLHKIVRFGNIFLDDPSRNTQETARPARVVYTCTNLVYTILADFMTKLCIIYEFSVKRLNYGINLLLTV